MTTMKTPFVVLTLATLAICSALPMNRRTQTVVRATNDNGVVHGYVVPPVKLADAPYAPWAHSHWVWLPSGESNQANQTQFVQDFLDRNIPVGAIDIDSQWATYDSDFVWNTKKFPNASQMISDLHAKGVKVICWCTSVVDNDSPLWQEGKAKGYFLKDPISDPAVIKWWHGHGSFVDYTNPEAVAWFHQQMDGPLSDGVDGWKVDGTDPYIFLLGVPEGKGGVVSYRDYADATYRDFLQYTRKVRGPEGLIMARPVDIDWSFAPKDTMFSGWVGDQDPTWDGLKAALANFIHSAWRGYLNYGSDIGGFRDPPKNSGLGPLGRTKELFTRWYQLGAFCPLMENGGDNEHRPWKFDAPNSTTVVDNYRLFVNIHMELGPYLLSTGTSSYAKNESVMHPQAINEGPLPFTPSSWAYILGSDIFVAPIVENTTSLKVEFPKGSDWEDWWNANQTYSGGSKIDYTLPMGKYAAFHRKGSILPLNVTNDLAGHGDASYGGYLTLLVSRLNTHEKVEVHEFQADGHTFEYTYTNGVLTFKASAHKVPIVIVLRGMLATAGTQVHVQHRVAQVLGQAETRVPRAGALATAGLGWAGQSDRVVIRIPDRTRGAVVTVSELQSL